MIGLLHDTATGVYALRWVLAVVACFLIFMVAAARFLERVALAKSALLADNTRLRRCLAVYAEHHATCRMRVASVDQLLEVDDLAAVGRRIDQTLTLHARQTRRTHR